jgi:hypothetical protein
VDPDQAWNNMLKSFRLHGTASMDLKRTANRRWIRSSLILSNIEPHCPTADNYRLWKAKEVSDPAVPQSMTIVT